MRNGRSSVQGDLRKAARRQPRRRIESSPPQMPQMPQMPQLPQLPQPLQLPHQAPLPAEMPVKVAVAAPSVWVSVQVASTPLLPAFPVPSAPAATV